METAAFGFGFLLGAAFFGFIGFFAGALIEDAMDFVKLRDRRRDDDLDEDQEARLHGESK